MRLVHDRVVLFYVQHLLGIGHLRRAALIARAIQAAGFDLRFVSGGEPVGDIDIGAGELIQLPPARGRRRAFLGDPRRRTGGRSTMSGATAPAAAAGRLRGRAAGSGAGRDVSLRPRASSRFELLPLLEAAKARRPAAPPSRCATSWWPRASPSASPRPWPWCAGCSTGCWSMATRGWSGWRPHFPARAEIADRLVYTGYVADARRPPASAGGGRRGSPGLRRRRGRRRAAAARRAWRRGRATSLAAFALAADRRAQPAGGGIRRPAGRRGARRGHGRALPLATFPPCWRARACPSPRRAIIRSWIS